MMDKIIEVNLELREVDLLRELLGYRIAEFKKIKENYESGDSSLIDEMDGMNITDIYYILECSEKIQSKFQAVENENEKNKWEYMDTTPIFRCEQNIETYQLFFRTSSRLVYVFKSRHGSFFCYSDLEMLIASFVKDEESELRFESNAELEDFLSYWEFYD